MRGHHIYCEDWTPVIGENLTLKVEPDNIHYEYAVAVTKNSMVVGHVPRPVSRVVFHFLRREGHKGLCEVTGNRLNRGANLGVEVPCIYKFYGRQEFIDRLDTLLHN